MSRYIDVEIQLRGRLAQRLTEAARVAGQEPVEFLAAAVSRMVDTGNYPAPVPKLLDISDFRLAEAFAGMPERLHPTTNR